MPSVLDGGVTPADRCGVNRWPAFKTSAWTGMLLLLTTALAAADVADRDPLPSCGATESWCEGCGLTEGSCQRICEPRVQECR